MSHQYKNSTRAVLLYTVGQGFQDITNPLPSFIDDPVTANYDGIRLCEEELSYLTFNNNMKKNPTLMDRWGPPIQAEVRPHIGKCLHRCPQDFFVTDPNAKIGKALVFSQEKRDATTGEHLKDKTRLAMLENLESEAGEHTNPIKNYCPTLGAISLRYLIANAA